MNLSIKIVSFFVSATPAPLELELSKENIFHQIMRPTGLLDPLIELKDSDNQVEILFDEAKKLYKETNAF